MVTRNSAAMTPIPKSFHAGGGPRISTTTVDAMTTLTLRHAGMPAGTMSDMTQAGWNESFDKLAESLQ